MPIIFIFILLISALVSGSHPNLGILMVILIFYVIMLFIICIYQSVTLVIIWTCLSSSLNYLLTSIFTLTNLRVLPYSLNCWASLLISYFISKPSSFVSIVFTFISTWSYFASRFSAGLSADLKSTCFFYLIRFIVILLSFWLSNFIIIVLLSSS